MTRLIVQSITDRDNEPYNKWMAVTYRLHATYAERCGADYRYFRGVKDMSISPSWVRIPLILEAFAEGYEEVVWLDADTLVVQPDQNIFVDHDRTGNACRRHRDVQNVTQASFQMTRQHDSHTEWPWRTDLESTTFDLYNCGVILARRTPEAIACLEWVWARRHDELRWYHVDRMWEMNWFNDYFYDHPDIAADLTEHWNCWHPFHGMMIEDPAIRGWHGRELGVAFKELLTLRRELYAHD